MRQFFQLLERFDWSLLTAALTLTAMSLVAIYGIDVSREPIELFTFYKQFAAAAIGFALVFGFILIDYRQLRSYGFFIYLFGASLLLLVLLFGHTVRSTQGWFRLGGLSFQPVEIAKVTLVIYLAALFVRSGYERLTWHIFGLGAAATFIYVILILLQPDFGSAMLLLVIWGGLSLFAGLPRRAWIILPVVVLTVGALVWAVGLKPYQRERVLSFLNPQTDTRGANYNALQARIAIGSGGWLGKGIGEGSQARLRFLPEAATDFLFAVLGEELGFVGVSVILGLFLLLLYRCIRLAQEAADDFAALLLIGLGAIVLVQLMVNAGMNLGIMPITGIPLPFISAAASSLVVAYVSIGIAESVAVRRRGAVAEEAS